jgi:hypothetical protein
VEARMLDRLVETFCDFDDFCTSIKTQWEALRITDGQKRERKHGPDCGRIDSEIMTLLVLYHRSRFKNFSILHRRGAWVAAFVCSRCALL